MTRGTARRKALRMLMTPEERREFEALELTVRLERKRAEHARASVQRINAEIKIIKVKHEMDKLEIKLQILRTKWQL